MRSLVKSTLSLAIAGLMASAIALAEDPAAISESEAAPAQAPAPEKAEVREALSLKELQIFADVFNQIRQGYVEEVDDSTLFEYAVRGMLEGLDPHSVYLADEAYDDLQTTTQGEFSGLGIEVGTQSGYIKIISPIDGSPAEAAGLQAGDIILELDGVSTKDIGLNAAVDRMRGPKGSEIVLTVGRQGEPEPLEVTVVRDVIKVASVRSRILSPGYAYLRIAQFQRNTGEETSEQIKKLLDEEGDLKGLILDLRNNPGGVLDASVEVADSFLDGGLVVYTEGRHPQSSEKYNATAGELLSGAPVVVLVNGGSASASEIVAGALQDRGRAIIMGTRSFGKGSVQTVLPVAEHRAVKLTTALYYTPNGRSIQAEGIVPDIIVERAKVTSMENGRRIKEADLNGRLDNKTEVDDEPTDAEVLKDMIGEDNQLYEALTLLRGVNIIKPTLVAKQQSLEVAVETTASDTE